MKGRSFKRRVFFITSIFLAILAAAALIFTPLSAQRATLALDDLIATGKTQLFKKTVPSALTAYQTFLGAYNDASYAGATAQQKIQIRGYLAFTRILDLLFRNDGGTMDTVTKLLAQYGVKRTGDTLETLEFHPVFNKDEKLIIPAAAPSGEAIRAFLAGPFLTAVNASIADMDEVINQCGAGEGVVIIEKNYISATETLNVEVDAGDYYLYRAALKALKAWALIVSAYNLEVGVQEIVGLANADLLNFKGLLDRYPNLLKLLTAGGTPAYNGAGKLAEARTAFQGAIADYLVASNKIHNYGPATPGAKKLFTIETPDLQREQFFRYGILNKVEASLSSGTPFEYVRDWETWVFTSTSPESFNKVTVNLKEMKSKGVFSLSGGYFFNDFSNMWGLNDIRYALVQGSDFILRFNVYVNSGGWYYNTAEFRGTIAGTTMSGTYRTGLSSQSWEEMTYRGTFTAVRTAYDDSTRERINPNAILGNGTTAPGLRDLLPEFTEYGWGNPKIGTMGHGLGNDATLNGLLPDFTQNRWAKDFQGFLQYSGQTGAIPVVSSGAIVVDGLVGDWTGISPVYNNTVGDDDNDPGRNISQVYLAQDGLYLYLRMDTAGGRLNSNAMYDYAVRFTTRPGDGPQMAGDFRAWARYAGYNDTWQINIPAQNGQPARTITMSAWGASEWGSYQPGQGYIYGPQGDAVFPAPTTPANLSWGNLPTGGGWFNFGFTAGTNSYQIQGSMDAGGNFTGAYVYANLNGAWNSYSSVTGTRTGHAPFWQTFLSRSVATANGVSYGPWEDLNNPGGVFMNMSAGVDNHVEWKVPWTKAGSVAGLFIQPETRVWNNWSRQGVETETSIQIGPNSGSSLASITGTVNVPSFDGTGKVIINVYEYHNFQRTAEYLLGTLIIPAAQFVNGMTYTIPNLPAGKRAFVVVNWTRGNSSGDTGPGDYTNFSQPFTTTAGATTQNIAATDDHPAYPAPQFTSVGVFSIRQTNTQAAPLQYALYADIAGGSPEDLAVTVTGPNNVTYTLTPFTTKFMEGGKQSFGWYSLTTNFFPDGEYTFEAIDSLGRKAVVTRNFNYNGAMPLIDPATLTPSQNQAYTGTATPTFSWTLPGTLPADYRIHVRVIDAFNSANGTGGTGSYIYQSANLPPTTTSLAIPAGFLQADTWYSWSVQIIDGEGRVTKNMTRTFGYPFYTGNYASSPAIAWGMIATQPPTGTITEYRHMAYAGIPGVAPWEIISGRIKDNSGNTINATLRAKGYETTKYRSGSVYIVYGSNAPLPDGNYKIEATINRGGSQQVIESATMPYAYHDTGAPDISALTPAGNYYFNTTTPTFTWPLIAAPNTWYRARIWDPLRRVEIAHSGWLKDASSWTVPADKLFRGMSYYWTLQTSSDYDSSRSQVTGQLNSFNFVNFEGNPGNRAMFLFTINPEESTTYQLSVSKDGSGTGTITSSPEGIDCGGACAAAFTPGIVSLLATPDYGSYFAGWTGCDVVTGDQCVINMNGAKAAKATFTDTPPFITVSGIVRDWNGNVIPGGVTVSLASDPAITTPASTSDGSFSLTGVPMNTPFFLKFTALGYLDTYTVNVGGQSTNVNVSTDNYGGSGPINMPTTVDLTAFGAMPDSGKAVIAGRVSDQTFRYSSYVGSTVVTAQGLNTAYPVKYRDPFGNLVDSASTWGNGRYYVLNVSPFDTVTLTAAKANWTFSPRTFSTHGNAYSQGRIYGTAPGYDASVSGSVKALSSGAAISGATLVLNGDPGKSTISGTDGSYTMSGLPKDAQFYMKVTAPGYVDAYMPHNLPGAITGSNKLMATAADMTNFGVTGSNGLLGVLVVDSTNMAPLGGATVTLTSKSGAAYNALYPGGSGATGASGMFLVPNVQPGDVVKMDVTKGGYTFKTAYLDCFAGSVTEMGIFGAPKYSAAMWSSHSILANGTHSYWVDANVIDQQELISAVAATGPGITGSLALQFNASSKQWQWWYSGATGQPNFGPTPPATPLNYTLTITEKGGAVVTKNFTITAFPNSFATGILPANNSTVHGNLAFSWTGYGAGYSYFITLYRANGEYVWYTNTTSTSVNYDGPALTDGNYTFLVMVRDLNGNQSFAYHSFTYSSALPALKGDLNGDNLVNMADAIIALKLIAGGAGEGIRANYATSGADVNGDNKAGLAEVIYILQKLASVRTTEGFVCGDTITYAGESYPTVKIGNQCWFAKNLNVGAMIARTTAQGNSCSSIQKYCLNDEEYNCGIYGGLYRWTQAMCGATTEKTQGVCPAGWHVPTDPEFVTLTNYLGSSSCTNYRADITTFCGAPAGDRMKAMDLCQGRTPCGDSGFNALLAGQATDSSFLLLGERTYFWTSSIHNDQAWRTDLWLDNAGVDASYFYSPFTTANSIRCLKD